MRRRMRRRRIRRKGGFRSKTLIMVHGTLGVTK
jgi:hypothetical protein